MAPSSNRRAFSTLISFGMLAAAGVAQEDWRDVAGFDVATYNGAAMALDPGGRIVRFGGNLVPIPVPGTVTPVTLIAQDFTQLWDGQVWNTVTGLTNVPPPRANALLAFDPTRQRTVLHGGIDRLGVVLADTWEWDGAQWSQVFPGAAPPPRQWAAMAYDGQNIVLFGGMDANYLPQGDTWSYDGVAWTLRSPATQPPARYSHGVAGGLAEIVIFGGFGAGLLGDTWRWNGTDWNPVATPTAPSGRGGVAMTYDSVLDRYLLHGGSSLLPLRDTWQFVAGQWSEIVTERNPVRGPYQGNAYHPATGRWVVTSSAGAPSPPNTSITSEFGPDLAYVRGYGVGCSPTTPGALTIELIDGQPRPGSSFTLSIGPVAGLGLFALGWSDAVAPFGPLPLSLSAIGGAANCTLWHSADFIDLLVGPDVTIPIPPNVTLIGVEFYAQGFDLAQPSLGALRVTRGFACGVDVN